MTLRWHGKVSKDMGQSVQAVHESPVPRIGGLAIFLTLCFSFQFVHFFWNRLFPIFDIQLSEVLSFLAAMLIAVSPIFLIGFIEDLTKKVSARTRLWVSVASGLLGCWLLQTKITTLGFNYLDEMLAIPLFAIAFTGFATAGVANAFNIVDGFNGLASFLALQALLGIGLLSYWYGDSLLLLMSLLVGGAVFGFLVLNWPFGRIFLGDGGAYLIGFMIAWVCVLLNERHEVISPYACLLLCAYPVIEVAYSSWRRIRRKQTSSRADSLHLHQLIYRQLICKWLKGSSANTKNSAAGLFCAMLALPTTISAILFHNSQTLLICIFIIYFCLYAFSYLFLANLDARKTARSSVVA
ncbi:MraY family glycosyltransferase [Polynucleobacter sinensis]|uniref:MraY family glycosyltransferase n=1 Tax=Polynucleobacter sinensis TaxID=1743157 RepID=UPI00155F3B33|nr:glycosyltransferase [Polynucleobacter sinensis]